MQQEKEILPEPWEAKAVLPFFRTILNAFSPDSERAEFPNTRIHLSDGSSVSERTRPPFLGLRPNRDTVDPHFTALEGKQAEPNRRHYKCHNTSSF